MFYFDKTCFSTLNTKSSVNLQRFLLLNNQIFGDKDPLKHRAIFDLQLYWISQTKIFLVRLTYLCRLTDSKQSRLQLWKKKKISFKKNRDIYLMIFVYTYHTIFPFSSHSVGIYEWRNHLSQTIKFYSMSLSFLSLSLSLSLTLSLFLSNIYNYINSLSLPLSFLIIFNHSLFFLSHWQIIFNLSLSHYLSIYLSISVSVSLSLSL